MREPERKRRGPIAWLAARTRRFWIIVVLIGVLALYVTSFGLWAIAPTSISKKTAILYRPVFIAARHSGPFRWLMTHYVDLMSGHTDTIDWGDR